MASADGQAGPGGREPCVAPSRFLTCALPLSRRLYHSHTRFQGQMRLTDPVYPANPPSGDTSRTFLPGLVLWGPSLQWKISQGPPPAFQVAFLGGHGLWDGSVVRVLLAPAGVPLGRPGLGASGWPWLPGGWAVPRLSVWISGTSEARAGSPPALFTMSY